MSPGELYPTLGPGPDPLPVCISCLKTRTEGVLVPLKSSLFICGTCASIAAIEASLEGLRMVCAAAIEADPAMIYRRAAP